jgi:glucuronate isomerase
MKDIFIKENFLLQSKTAEKLYHDFAENQPIIDYHCHISPKEIAENRKFENITKIWLDGDHYKWRAMRTAGIPEKFITGDASDWEKFEAWAETVPKTIKNPLYHWTHLELKRPFGISDRILSKDTAKDIWEECNEKLHKDDFTSQGIIKQMNVEVICTTDDPIDSLEYHIKLKGEKNFEVFVIPAFRPDKGMMIDVPDQFLDWEKKLSEATDMEITNFSKFLEAIRKRHDYFHHHGCRLSDHGIETIYAEDYTISEIENIFRKAINEKILDAKEVLKFKSAMLYEFALMNDEKGWVQQFHIGALRNNNSRLFKKLGPDKGFDSIGDLEIAKPLAKFLDKLDQDNKLAKTILYNLNPRDNDLMATMIGNFQDGTIPGKIQYGSAWWFLDQKSGMEKQIESLSNMGLLSQFVGMLTDSRSFLSYSRHEYFRRILCDILGNEIEKGLIPKDIDLIGGMVKDICYFNAKKYFNFPS